MKKCLRLLGWLLLAVILWNIWCLVAHRWRNIDHAPDPNHQTLTILTYNTQRMGDFANPDKNAVIHYLQQSKADVLCLQEVEVYKDNRYLTLNELRDAFSSYPYTYYDFKIYNARRQYGNVVFSRYPLINKHTIQYASRGNITSCCDMVVGNDTLRLMVNYLESNHISLVEQKDTLIDRVEAAGRIRCRQALVVKKAMFQSPYPLLVVGDFNALPIGFTYQCLKLGLRDCFLETNRWCLGCTYRYKNFGGRIDYILCSRSLHPYQCCVDEVSASDHYPVWASIEWVPGNGNR